MSMEIAKFLDCACLFWRFGHDAVPVRARNHNLPSMKKRQKGQPHSTTLARGSHEHGNCEVFGLRLSFLALWARCRTRASEKSQPAEYEKAAEGTASLHDAGARFA